MDNLSDSCKGELDSVTSTDSLQLITDEFHLRHLSTPDVSNIESSKRMALLELENERFRTDLENTRIELDARIAANQGLKAKITELYVEVQSVLQEKQKLQNALTDTNSRLSIAESSVKWYQSQVHSLQACKKALQTEINTYQEILKQRQQAVVCMNARYKQLNVDYVELVEKCRKEKRILQNELNELKVSDKPASLTNKNVDTDVSSDLSTKLEVTEEELRDTKMELKTMEQRVLSNEIAKISMETIANKQRILITTMEETIRKCEAEKNEIADRLRKTQLEIQKLRSDNETLQSTLLSSKHEQMQIEDAIFQLGSQLSKMLAQYKLLKSKNAEYEQRLSSMRDLTDENKRLRTLSYEANSSLLRKLRQQKQKIKSLENKLREERAKDQFYGMKFQAGFLLQDSSKQTSPNKDTKERAPSVAKTSDESIDEGYADISTIGSLSVDIPAPILINSALLNTASDVLAKSKHLLTPVQAQVDKLQLKMEVLQNQSMEANQEVLCCI